MLINPAICLPSFWPISSTISMHSKSSLLTAVMISSNVGGFSAVRFESMELSPLPILSNRMRCSADPEASVSRHPFCRSGTVFHCRKTLTCPEFSGKSDFPVYTFPSMMMPIPSPQLILTKMMSFPLDASLHVLSIGHGPCVVVYADRVSYLFIQYICQRTL